MYVTTLRVLKNLDSMSFEELVNTLKVHEQELQQDNGSKREKSLALSSQKNKKASSTREQVLRSSSKVHKVDDSSDNEYEEDSDEDELTFISRNIHKTWRNKGGSKWKNSSRRMSKERKDKDKNFIICYEYKKLGHFKSECSKLEKSQDKKKFFKIREKKGLMSTQEDLDDTTSNEDDEEANICLMVDTTSEEFESDQEDEINFDDPESLRKAYHELLSNSSILSKAYKNLQRDFKNLFRDHLKLVKTFQDQVDVSLDESTQTCQACITLKEKESKLCLKIETSARERATLLKKFQKLENKLKDL